MLDALSKGETVGERIAYHRKRKKLSQQQLADLAGVSVCTIKRMENYKCESNFSTYHKVVTALQVNPDLIYDDYFKFITSDYSQWLKSFRYKHKLTQMHLSELLHVHVKTVMRWEQKELIPNRKHYQLIQQLR